MESQLKESISAYGQKVGAISHEGDIGMNIDGKGIGGHEQIATVAAFKPSI